MINKPRKIALLSGKGGSGKTTIGLSLAKILSETGIKVLFIDCDTATHGATYFFEEELDRCNEPFGSLFDLLHGFIARPLSTSEGFSFLPSILKIAEAQNADYYVPEFTFDESSIKSMTANFDHLCDPFDVVIMDCQAGNSSMVKYCANYVDRNIIVLEADSINYASLRVLYLQNYKALSKVKSWQLINKITESERLVYERGPMGATLFPDLPPLSFDWQVRAAFAIGKIPGSIPQYSEFNLRLIELARIIFPALTQKLAPVEDIRLGNWFRGYCEQYFALRKSEKSISRMKQKARFDEYLSVILKIPSSMLVGFMAFALSLRLVPINSYPLSIQIPIVLVIFIIPTLVSIIIFNQFRPFNQNSLKQHINKIEQSTKALEALRSSVNSYHSLLSINPDLLELNTILARVDDDILDFDKIKDLPFIYLKSIFELYSFDPDLRDAAMRSLRREFDPLVEPFLYDISNRQRQSRHIIYRIIGRIIDRFGSIKYKDRRHI